MTDTTMDVLDLLPHRPPMVVVRRLLKLDTEAFTASCLCQVSSDSPLVRGGWPPRMILVEMLAQSAACLKGYMELMKGRRVRPAYLVRADEVRTEATPVPGQDVTVTVKALRGLGDYFIYEASASGPSGTLASGTLRFIVQSSH